MSKVVKKNGHYYVTLTDDLASSAAILSCGTEAMVEDNDVQNFFKLIDKDFKFKPKFKLVKLLVFILSLIAVLGIISIYFLSYWFSLAIVAASIGLLIILTFFANRIKKPNHRFNILIPILLFAVLLAEALFIFFNANQLFSSFAILDYHVSDGTFDLEIVEQTKRTVLLFYLISTIVPLILSIMFTFLSKKKASSVCCLSIASICSPLFIFFINLILNEDDMLKKYYSTHQVFSILSPSLLVVGICFGVTILSLLLMIDARRSKNE